MSERQWPLIVPRGGREYPALYDGAPPSVNQDTSRIASGSVRTPSHALRQRVRGYLERSGATGATCDEAEAALDLRHQTCGPRIRELVQLGVLRDSGQRRPTRSGRGAIVWVVQESA